jgi:hypothetical protein
MQIAQGELTGLTDAGVVVADSSDGLSDAVMANRRTVPLLREVPARVVRYGHPVANPANTVATDRCRIDGESGDVQLVRDVTG